MVVDFNADGEVGFSDFLLFAAAFGSRNPAYDLDTDRTVGFSDFLVFAAAFPSNDGDIGPTSDPASAIDGPIVISSPQDLSDLLARVTPDRFEILGSLRVSGNNITDDVTIVTGSFFATTMAELEELGSLAAIGS